MSAEAVNSNSSGSIRECVDHCDAKGGSGAGRAAAKDEGTGLLAVHSSYYPEEGERKEPKCRAWKRDRISGFLQYDSAHGRICTTIRHPVRT